MDHSDNALRTAIKALTDVVAPAVDPADAQATAQLRLVVQSLEFLLLRLDDRHARERFELEHQLTLARSVAGDAPACSPAIAAELSEAIGLGDVVLARAGAAPVELRAATAALGAALRRLVRAAADAEAPVRDRIERRVLDGTRAYLVMDRAWHLPKGFDPEPATVPLLEAVLGPDAAPG